MNIRHLTSNYDCNSFRDKARACGDSPSGASDSSGWQFPLYLALFILPTGLRLNLPSLPLPACGGEQAPVLGQRSLNPHAGLLLVLTEGN